MVEKHGANLSTGIRVACSFYFDATHSWKYIETYFFMFSFVKVLVLCFKKPVDALTATDNAITDA